MQLGAVFDALANEPRREMVVRLARGSMTTPEIGRHFGFTRQALNRHVGILEDAGLIRRTLRGRVHEVTLVRSSLDEMAEWVSTARDACYIPGTGHARSESRAGEHR